MYFLKICSISLLIYVTTEVRNKVYRCFIWPFLNMHQGTLDENDNVET